MDAWPFILNLRLFPVGGIRLKHCPRIAKWIGARNRPIGPGAYAHG